MANGAMTMDRFMAFALCHPEHGYYMSGESFGVKGDFITAPEISQIFGELIGLWAFDQMQQQNILDQAGLFELGPGRGTLMADAIRAILPFSDKPSLPVHMLEISPALKLQQSKALSQNQVSHHDDLENLPPKPLIFIANEFFDALPIRQFIKQDDGWHERVVVTKGDELTLTSIETTSIETSNSKMLASINSADVQSGQVVEIAPSLPDITRKICRHINQYGGAALFIDYGKSNAIGDSLQAVRDHRPVDILDTPGQADLSAWVDFSAITNTAIETDSNAVVLGPTHQGSFLKALGLYQRAEQLSAAAPPQKRRMIAAAVDRLSSPQQMGHLFQVMAILPPQSPRLAAGFAP